MDGQLVNPPHGDPALYVRLNCRAGVNYLFDCGELHALPNVEILRVRRIFISHTHIDHCIGFDHLIRVQLYSPTPLDIYGPPGLIEQFSGRLRGYVWNLTGDSPYTIQLHEFHADHVESRTLRCQNQFLPGRRTRQKWPGSLTLKEGYSLRWAPLEHGVPCLAYLLSGVPFHRFNAQKAAQMGIEPGIWIGRLKELAARGRLAQRLNVGGHKRSVGEWSTDLLVEEPPPTLGYVTDTLLGDKQRQRLVPFLKNCQQLWCESTYREADSDKALANLHATASQAARLAREAEAKKLCLFHISRRYQGDTDLHLEEAREIFPATVLGGA